MRGREIIAFNIRRIRVVNDISQERLAFDAGVDRSYLGSVERGEANPTIDMLDRLAETLGVPLIQLFAEYEGGSTPKQSLKRGRKKGNI